MAKKNTTATENTATPPTAPDKTAGKKETAPKKVGRPAGQSTKESDIFRTVDPQPDDKDVNNKLAPQAQAIANIVKAAGPAGLTRKDLVAQMDGVVTTRQPQGRILSYYQKTLTDKEFVTIESPTKSEVPAEAPTA
jgi:hypothetical protein